MPQLRDFLSRFRPAGAPGAARAAVPADHDLQLAQELEPILTLLDDPHRECAQIIAAARHDAEQILAAARADAAALAAATRRDTAATRRQTVERELAAARATVTDILTSAERQAAQVRELASRRMPAMVQRSVALIRDLPEADPLPRYRSSPGPSGEPS